MKLRLPRLHLRRGQCLTVLGLQLATMSMASSTIFHSAARPDDVVMLAPIRVHTHTTKRSGNANAVDQGRRTPLAFATRQPPRCLLSSKSRAPTEGLPRLVPSRYYAKSDDDILTPGTYANSRMAKRQVKDIITSKATEAFDSTDFAHEPHLSPELEDAEIAYEAALLANAAHELADAAEKENRQSKAAMMERERELEWIEKHDSDNDDDDCGDNKSAAASMKAEAFQRSLLAAQLANRNSQRAATNVHQEKFQRSLLSARIANEAFTKGAESRQQETFQRSLLSARIANDAKAKANTSFGIEQQQKEDWLGSEIRAASMGGPECLPFSVASAAVSSAASHAMEDAETAKPEVNDVAAVAASMVADTTERMILGEDIAYQVMSENDKQKREQLWMQTEVLSEVDHKLREYVRQKGIEQAKEKHVAVATTGDNEHIGVGSAEVDSASSALEALAVKDANSGDDSVIEMALQRGFTRRMRQRRRLLVVALAVVISRRFFLALSGNALRLI